MQKGDVMLREKERTAMNGLGMLVVLPAVVIGLAYLAIQAIRAAQVVPFVLYLLAAIVVAIGLGGFFVVNPNQGSVLQLFGDYKGTVKRPGLRWANPFYSKRRVSLRVRNFETAKLKVNDARGNPIEIATVVVWRVIDTAEAVFHVDDYENFVHVQSEAALRNLATGYPYDAHGDEVDLVSHTAEVSKQLQKEIHDRLAQAGVEVIETRISHLAYSQEIAAAMLRRQQATAVVAARQKIVEGAVGMVEMALEMLAQKQVITLDEERKAAMVSNLMVVLCSEQNTQPVINAGTLHN
jgi:regulator of protease activity HflC (stomatin/prohibitin superfamily)